MAISNLALKYKLQSLLRRGQKLNILGVDLGTTTCGLSISDSKGQKAYVNKINFIIIFLIN